MFTEDDRAAIIALVTPLLERTLSSSLGQATISVPSPAWRPGTCISVDTEGVAQILVDGDTATIGVGVIGDSPPANSRVMVVFVPPAAVFCFAIMAGWVDYVPTLTQGAAVAKTVTMARYRLQAADLVVWELDIQTTAAGTGGTDIEVGLPLPYEQIIGDAGAGQWQDVDASSGRARTLFRAERSVVSATVPAFKLAWEGGTISDALGVGDIIRASGWYRPI